LSSGTFYSDTSNNFDSTALTTPKVIIGIASGNGDRASYTSFNLAINSWQGVGFFYSNPGTPPLCNFSNF